MQKLNKKKIINNLKTLVTCIHPIINVVAAVVTASNGVFILRPVFRPSIAYLNRNGTETFRTLAPINKPNANVTLFFIFTSFCK